MEDFGNVEGASEGSHLAKYKFDKLKKEKEEIKPVRVSLLEDDTLDKSLWEAGKIKAEAQNLARELMDTPSNLMTPSILAQTIRSAVRGLQHVSVRQRDLYWIKDMKMGCFLSVTKGSHEPPSFIELEYKPPNAKGKPIVLVGKVRNELLLFMKILVLLFEIFNTFQKWFSSFLCANLTFF